jgi:hypothetical protein
MPRFVILRHDAPQGSHFDFMLEAEGVLRTWSLPQPPENGAAFECQSLADHRTAYLDYEGQVSGGRGDVTRWDRGVYSVERQDDAEWIVELSGEKIAGRAVLLRSADATNCWLFSFRQAENA